MKNLYSLISLFVVTIALYSCGTKQKEATLEEAKIKLKVTSIFKRDSVSAFLSANKDLNADLSEKYIQKAEAAVKNDLNKAEFYYKKAITLYPSDKNYILYGNMLYEKKKYSDAAKVFGMAVFLSAAQTQDQYLLMVKNDLLSEEYEINTEILQGCFKQGYNMQSLIETILEDEYVKDMVSRKKANYFVMTLVNRSEWNIAYQSKDTAGAAFSDYVKLLQPINLPFVCTKNELQKFKYHNSFEGEYDDYDPSKDFSRFMEYTMFKTKFYGATDFQYLVKEVNGKTLVIHAVDTSTNGVPRDMRCIYHRLIIFNNQGQKISTKVIGLHAGETLTTYKINPDLTIETETFQRIWRKPFDRSDLDNEIIASKSVEALKYKVAENGMIEMVAN